MVKGIERFSLDGKRALNTGGAKGIGRAMVAAGRGSVISVSSMCGTVPVWPQPQAAYNASKAGVDLLRKSLAVEWAASGVRVNAIAPGYSATELTLAGRALSGSKSGWSALPWDASPILTKSRVPPSSSLQMRQASSPARC